jgi:hypothetical protein
LKTRSIRCTVAAVVPHGLYELCPCRM